MVLVKDKELTRFTFEKIERLTGKTTIDRLFNEGESFFSFPFRVVYLRQSTVVESPYRVLINVPKRLHKHAVTRNLLKRRIREAYRLNKSCFYQDLGETSLDVAFLYSAKDVMSSEDIDRQLKKAQRTLIKRLQ